MGELREAYVMLCDGLPACGQLDAWPHLNQAHLDAEGRAKEQEFDELIEQVERKQQEWERLQDFEDEQVANREYQRTPTPRRRAASETRSEGRTPAPRLPAGGVEGQQEEGAPSGQAAGEEPGAAGDGRRERYSTGRTPGRTPRPRRTESAAAGDTRQQAAQLLDRCRARFVLDLRDVTTAVEELQGASIANTQLDLLEGDLTTAEKEFWTVLDAFDALVLHGTDEENAVLDAERDRFYKDAGPKIWALRRRARAVPRRELQTPAPADANNSGRRSHVEKVSLPTFSGKAEEFHEFRRVFTELAEHEDYSDPLYLSQLRGRLSGDAKLVIVGITAVEEAWEELGRRYGSREQAILVARQRLLDTRLRGPWFQQVEELHQAVRCAHTALRAVDASAMLFGDFSTPGVLCSKLPLQSQYSWHTFIGSRPAGASPEQRGTLFMEWLKREELTASSARLQHLGSELRRPERLSGTAFATHSAGPEAAPETPHGASRRREEEDTGAEEHIPNEVWKAKLQTEEGAKEMREVARRRAKPCPACQKLHTYARRFSGFTLEWGSDRLENCPVYMARSPADRARLLEQVGGCCVCTAYGHARRRCNGARTARRCQAKSGTKLCGQEHHSTLHGSASIYCSAAATSARLHQPADARADRFPGPAGSQLTHGTKATLFELSDVALVNPDSGVEQAAVSVADSCSNINFIREEAARSLGLHGTPSEVQLKVIDNDYATKQAMIYQVGIKDRNGGLHYLECLSVQSIMDSPFPGDLSEARDLFPAIPEAALKRPTGPVTILISMAAQHLHAYGGETAEGLRLQDSPLTGCGKVLTGVLRTAPAGPGALSPECQALQAACVRLPAAATTLHTMAEAGPRFDFHEAAELECRPPPLCASCRGCATCSSHRRAEPKELEVLERVDREMVLDKERRRLTASYPWTPAALKMKSNRRQALTVQRKIEERSLASGHHARTVEAVEEMITAGALRELTEGEMVQYKGPVNYITLFPVFKEGSVTTKVRICSNAALPNPTSGLSLNEVMEKGPNLLAVLTDVLLHWRTIEVAVVTDLKKAYWQIETREKELHLRRVLFRSDPTKDFTTYAFTCATFGDLIAGVLLEVGRRRGAEVALAEAAAMAEAAKTAPGAQAGAAARAAIHLAETARQIRDKTFVDDSVTGGGRELVESMVGDHGTINHVFGAVGLKAKHIIVSGDADPEAAAALGGSVLGVKYQLKEDRIVLGVNLKYGRKTRGKNKEEVKLTAPDLAKIREGTGSWTRRMALSLVMATFDPLSLIGPVMLTGKLLLRRLASAPVQPWDTELPAADKLLWAVWMGSLLAETETAVERAVTPEGASGPPTVVGYADASIEACCAAIYVIWPLAPTGDAGRFSSRLLIAKTRVSPIFGSSIPRCELQALCILMRLQLVALAASAFSPASLVTATDSRCVVAALRKPGAAMKPFFRNRVGEINHLLAEARELCPGTEEVTWVPGSLNPADVGTRPGVSMANLSPTSVWMRGPEFHQTPRSQWPLEAVGAETGIPREEERQNFVAGTGLATTARTQAAPATPRLFAGIVKMVAAASTFARAVGSVARLIRGLTVPSSPWGRGPERTDRHTDPTPEERGRARRLVILASSPSAAAALAKGKLTSLGAFQFEGVVWLDGRLRGEDLAVALGKQRLPIILPEEPLARLIIEDAHREDHRLSSNDVVGRSRREAWIPRAARLARRAVSSCMFCRFRNKKMEVQLMGRLPPQKLSQSRPFTFASVDQFGPFMVRDCGNGRRTFKCHITLYSCLYSKAVALYVTPGESAKVFLETHAKQVAGFGKPKECFSDHLPAAVSATTAAAWEEIRRAAGLEGTRWTFTEKGSSFRNGQCERAIQLARRSLEHVLPRHAVLDYNEFDTVLRKVQHIINSRPIAARSTSEMSFHSLCPNDLLIGIPSHGEAMPLEETEEADASVAAGWDAKQKIVQAFWADWTLKHWGELVPRRKWTQLHRPVQAGDICHLQYKSKFSPPEYRLCRISRTFPDEDGTVRSCEVVMRPRHATDRGKPYRYKEPVRIRTAVQRLAVLLPVSEQQGGTESRAAEAAASDQAAVNHEPGFCKDDRADGASHNKAYGDEAAGSNDAPAGGGTSCTGTAGVPVGPRPISGSIRGAGRTPSRCRPGEAVATATGPDTADNPGQEASGASAAEEPARRQQPHRSCRSKGDAQLCVTFVPVTFRAA
jgi:uncharacterized membrane protein